jgi:hypothetical protein
MKHKELAEQAGFRISSASSHISDIGWVWCSDGYPIDEELERFAELVRADEREAVIDIVARHGGSVEIEAAVRQRGEK